MIVPLMQHDAMTTYHWITGAQFLNAVALGQVTPAPSSRPSPVGSPAGWSRRWWPLPLRSASFCFVLFGGRRFDQIRANTSVQAFLTGAGPAVIGAIAGSAIPLGLALGHLWQLAVLSLAAVWLLAMRKGVVVTIAIAGAGALGVLAVLAGAPFNH